MADETVFWWGRVSSELASGSAATAAGPRSGVSQELLAVIHSTLQDYPEALTAVVLAVENWDGMRSRS